MPTPDWQKLRLDGVYRMNEADRLMLRIKVPAGVLSAEQADAAAALAQRFAGGMLHLTVRGSIELHGLVVEQLPEAWRRLAAVGLTTRGACGGAVRGVSCSTAVGGDFTAAQVLARALHRHFAGNPHFEGLPKKFKIAVEGGYDGSRHLIQDLGLVLNGGFDDGRAWDVWLAGGLGREPQASFLYAGGMPEGRLIPLIEAVLRLYRRHLPKGRRLKHLVREIGEAGFRQLLQMEIGTLPAEIAPATGAEKALLPAGPHSPCVRVPVFAGQLMAEDLYSLSDAARRHGGGFLVLTADQDLALFPADPQAADRLRETLVADGLLPDTAEARVAFRVCPGGHECRMGLAPTRDLARRIVGGMGEEDAGRSWAIAGCPNSCAQPQLADIGIVAVRRRPGPDGSPQTRYDLWRRQGRGLGEKVAEDLTEERLLEAVRGVTG